MDRKWLRVLCCPLCKSNLRYLEIDLRCEKCKRDYHIIEGIPVLLDQKIFSKVAQFVKQKKYFDKSFSKEEKVLREWQKAYIRRIFNLFKLKPEGSKELFLDIGVGAPGYTVIEVAKRGHLAVGCDLSLPGLIKAKEFAKEQGLDKKILWVVCNAEQLPFKDAAFRYICSNAVLEHLPNDGLAVSEINRVASSKADLFLTVPLKYRYLWPFFWPINYIYDKNIGHLRRYDEVSIKEKMKATNFSIKKVFYTGHFLKMVLHLIAVSIKTDRFDKLKERVDENNIYHRYGASNISVYSRNYDRP